MENEVVDKKKKELFLERLRAKYPEIDPDNEDDFFGRVNDDYEQYEGRISESAKHESELANLLSSDPRSADFLMSWKSGESPAVLMMRMFGPEFSNALEDPELQEKLSEARNEYIARQTKDRELQEQAKINLSESLANLDAVQEECKLSEEQADAIFMAFDKIVDDAIINKVSKQTWEMIRKSLDYDKDIEAAAHEGEVRGRNTKIDTNKQKRTIPENLPPAITGNGAIADTKRADLGVLERFGNSGQSVWERGGMKRRR